VEGHVPLRAGWYFSLLSPLPFPLSFQTNQWEGRSDPVRGNLNFPGFPPTNITLPPCLMIPAPLAVRVDLELTDWFEISKGA